MNLKELAFPIRIYWDLTPHTGSEDCNYVQITEDIVKMKFFTLNLLDNGVKLSSACIEILEKLKNEMISVSLTVSHSALDSPAMALLADLKINELLVEASTDDDIRLTAQMVQQYKDMNMTLGASFQVNGDNYRSIPDVVSSCLNNDIVRLVFPMQRVTSKDNCSYISREEGSALTQKLNELDISKMKITIHDPFLWKIFYPAVSFPGGGCQAANSMVSIAPDGNVHPCPSMPLPLGNLKEITLKTILTSAGKEEALKIIREAPEECRECEELIGCMGGCKGRTFALTGSMLRPDPACK